MTNDGLVTKQSPHHPTLVLSIILTYSPQSCLATLIKLTCFLTFSSFCRFCLVRLIFLGSEIWGPKNINLIVIFFSPDN